MLQILKQTEKMKRACIFIFIAFCPLLSVSQSPDVVTIKGIVKYKFDSSLLSYSRLQVVEDEKPVLETLTDKDGKFEIIAPINTTYKLRFAGLDELEFDTIINTSKIPDVLEVYVGIVFPERFLKYNSTKAKRDINEGNVQILIAGLPIVPLELLEKTTKKYGFTYKDLGQYISDNLYQSMKIYNSTVYDYLDEINDEGWREEFEARKEKKIEKILYKMAKKDK